MAVPVRGTTAMPEYPDRSADRRKAARTFITRFKTKNGVTEITSDLTGNVGKLGKVSVTIPTGGRTEFSNVKTPDGKVRKAEVHWFESDEVGQARWKVKRILEG